MREKKTKKERRGFFWLVLSIGLLWALFCHGAPLAPQETLISFIAGMAPPLLLAAPLILACLILAFRAFRKPAWGALRIGFVVLLLAALALLGVEVNLPGDEKMIDFKVMTLNVHYSSRRLPKALAYIQKHKFDAVLLQENKGGSESPARWLAQELGWQLVEADEVAIISPWPLGKPWALPSQSLEFRSLLAVEVGAPKPFTAATVHWSSPQYLKGVSQMELGASRQALDYKQTKELIGSIRGPWVLGGDFNNPPHHQHTRSLSRIYENSFSAKGFGLGWTYHRKLPLVRIDHLYAGGGIKTESCTLGPELGSDHLPLAGGFSLGPADASGQQEPN